MMSSHPSFRRCNAAAELRRIGAERGFSLVELMIVVVIIMCMAAITAPTMLQVLANTRTRNTMNNLSGIIQRCRSEAVRKNTTWSVHFSITSSEYLAFAKDATAGTSAASTDPQMILGSGVVLYRTLPAGAPPAMTSTDLWGSSSTAPQPSTADVSFNSRGMPCEYNAGACQNKGFVYYFTYLPPFGKNGWAAMSISPAGRIKAWIWDGHAWNN